MILKLFRGGSNTSFHSISTHAILTHHFTQTNTMGPTGLGYTSIDIYAVYKMVPKDLTKHREVSFPKKVDSID